jgi:hypothetical protein
LRKGSAPAEAAPKEVDMSRIIHRDVRAGRGQLLVAVGLAAIGALIFAAFASASSLRAAASSPPTDKLAETSSNMNLSTVGGQDTTILSMTLPAGSWVISSEDTLVNFGPSDYTRCQIVAAGKQVASGSTMVGDPSQTGAEGPASFVAGRGLVGSVKSTSSFSVSLDCSHDHDTPGSNAPPYVDSGAVIWAHLGPRLSGTTH